MHHFKLFLCLFSLLFFAACKTEKPTEEAPKKSPFQIRNVPAPNRMITKYELIHPKFEGSILNELHLNKAGQKTQWIGFDIYDQGKASVVIDYKYDRKKRLKEKVWNREGNEKIYQYKYKKDKLISETATKEGAIISSIDYQYDEAGNLIEELYKDAEGNTKNRFVYQYEYDEADSLTLEKKSKINNGTSEFIYHRSYKFNPKGKRTEFIEHLENGIPKRRCIYNYTSKGSLNESLCFDDVNQTENLAYLFFYNEYGERIREDVSSCDYEGENQELVYRNFWEYDEWGQEVGFWFEYYKSENSGGEKTVYTIFEE